MKKLLLIVPMFLMAQGLQLLGTSYVKVENFTTKVLKVEFPNKLCTKYSEYNVQPGSHGPKGAFRGFKEDKSVKIPLDDGKCNTAIKLYVVESDGYNRYIGEIILFYETGSYERMIAVVTTTSKGKVDTKKQTSGENSEREVKWAPMVCGLDKYGCLDWPISVQVENKGGMDPDLIITFGTYKVVYT